VRTIAAAAAALALAIGGGGPRSPFAWRGIVEGFYGTPYTHAERLDLLRFEAAHGMNAYIHAPKNDPYVRARWRHPYPAPELAEMLSEVRFAHAHGIAWAPDVGPGVPEIPSPAATAPDRDICFSCPADRAALIARYRPFVAAGSTAIVLSFDDVQKVSTHPADARAYGTGDAAYGRMNAELANSLVRAFPGTAVMVVPADYSGTSRTAYLDAFAAHLDKRAVVVWTGTAVVARRISGADAARFDAIVGRRALVWDNYPANDYAGGILGDPTNLFLGPVTGRGPDLAGRVAGIVANPMDEWAPSKIALATLADDLADPRAYDPESSWRRSLAEIGGRGADALAKLAENTRSSPLGQTESIVFEPRRAALLAAYGGAFWPAPASALSQELAAEAAAPARLAAVGFDPAFRREAAPFLRRLTMSATAGADAVGALAAERPRLDVRVDAAPGGVRATGSAAPPSPVAAVGAVARMRGAQAATDGDRHNVFGDRFFADPVDPGPGAVTANANLMDRFVDSVEELSGAWLPRAAVAGSRVSVTANGRVVPNRFSLFVPLGRTLTLIATDGAGGRTGVVVSG
jgi:hyaluronoglucosaminidase